jgi:F-type H+-transporting ATPase subunit b
MHLDWWTLALQTVNVLVLIWILARFFFRPIADLIAKRQEEMNKLFADAEAAGKQAAAARNEAEKARGEIAAERDRLLAEAQKAAQAEKAKLLEQAAQDVAKLRRESEAAIARDRAAAEQQLIDHASTLSLDIARRLLARLPANLALEAFLAALCAEIGKLAPEARNGFDAAAASGRPIEVVTAAALSETETRAVREALSQAFGRDLPLSFRSDPSLLAGIELQGHNVILRNSWRADLDKIREELSRERHANKS